MEVENLSKRFEIVNPVIHLAPLLVLVALGVFFAHRWLVQPPPAILRYPRALRIAALMFGCWIGTFVATTISQRLGSWWFDGVAYDGNTEVPYLIMHDGTGSNVWNLAFGWLTGWIAYGIAKSLPRGKPPESIDSVSRSES